MVNRNLNYPPFVCFNKVASCALQIQRRCILYKHADGMMSATLSQDKLTAFSRARRHVRTAFFASNRKLLKCHMKIINFADFVSFTCGRPFATCTFSSKNDVDKLYKRNHFKLNNPRVCYMRLPLALTLSPKNSIKLTGCICPT
jgi:hypothetical protein